VTGKLLALRRLCWICWFLSGVHRDSRELRRTGLQGARRTRRVYCFAATATVTEPENVLGKIEVATWLTRQHADDANGNSCFQIKLTSVYKPICPIILPSAFAVFALSSAGVGCAGPPTSGWIVRSNGSRNWLAVALHSVRTSQQTAPDRQRFGCPVVQAAVTNATRKGARTAQPQPGARNATSMLIANCPLPASQWSRCPIVNERTNQQTNQQTRTTLLRLV